MKKNFGIVDMRWILINSILLLFFGCSSTSTPPGWLPRENEIAFDGRGGWVDIESSNQIFSSGELISIQEDTLFFLEDGKLTFFCLEDISIAKVAAFDNNDKLNTIRNVTILGIATCVSHGWFGFFTAPMWVVTGFYAASKFSESSIYKFPSSNYPSIKSLSKYSRYPMGIPKDLDRSLIRKAKRSKFSDIKY